MRDLWSPPGVEDDPTTEESGIFSQRLVDPTGGFVTEETVWGDDEPNCLNEDLFGFHLVTAKGAECCGFLFGEEQHEHNRCYLCDAEVEFDGDALCLACEKISMETESDQNDGDNAKLDNIVEELTRETMQDTEETRRLMIGKKTIKDRIRRRKRQKGKVFFTPKNRLIMETKRKKIRRDRQAVMEERSLLCFDKEIRRIVKSVAA